MSHVWRTVSRSDECSGADVMAMNNVRSWGWFSMWAAVSSSNLLVNISCLSVRSVDCLTNFSAGYSSRQQVVCRQIFSGSGKESLMYGRFMMNSCLDESVIRWKVWYFMDLFYATKNQDDVSHTKSWGTIFSFSTLSMQQHFSFRRLCEISIKY